MTIAETSLEYSGLYEAELLLELMLRYWSHPFAADSDFRENLIEGAAEVLHAAISGMTIVDGIPSESTNLVMAIWYAECVSAGREESEAFKQFAERREWLDRIRRALPACFCNPDELI